MKEDIDKKEIRRLRGMLRQRHRAMKEMGCTRVHMVNGKRLKNGALIDYLHQRIEFLTRKIENRASEPAPRKRRVVGPARGRRGGV